MIEPHSQDNMGFISTTIGVSIKQLSILCVEMCKIIYLRQITTEHFYWVLIRI